MCKSWIDEGEYEGFLCESKVCSFEIEHGIIRLCYYFGVRRLLEVKPRVICEPGNTFLETLSPIFAIL